MRVTSSLSGPLTRYCTGQPTAGPSSSGDTRPTRPGNSSASSFSSLRLQPQARVEVLGNDHRLREELVLQLHVERQVEADRAAADVGAPVVDVRILGEELLEARGDLLGGEDRRVLAQRHVDQQFRPVRGGEELPRHELQEIERGDERRSVSPMVSHCTRIAPTSSAR